MKKQFLKMFLLILGISLCVLSIQGISLLYANYRAVSRWPHFVITEYLDSVVEHAENTKYENSTNVINTLLEKTPDTISGLLIRDKDANYSLMYGSSTRGRTQDRKSLRIMNQEDGSEVSLLLTLGQDDMLVEDNSFSKKVSVFTLNVNTSDDIVVSYTDKGKENIAFTTPGFLTESDVAGRVYINYNGYITGSFDVIIYDLRNFGPTLMLLREVVLSFLFFLPIALLVSVIASYRISKTTAKNTAIIKDSLSKLSNGDYSFTIPKMKVEEFNKIATSIEALKIAMEQNEKSRHEWILSISHDLNTPVTSLIMLYEGLKDQIFTLDEATLNAIHKELETLKNRISAVSYYTNLRLIGGFESLKEFNLNNYVKDIASHFPELECVYLGSLDSSVKGDSAMISRALYEAFKNMNEYATDKKVFVDISKTSNEVTLKLKNKGTIDTNASLFELWTRGDVSRTDGGSGLGLPIIKRIMDLNNGTVSIVQDNEFVVLELKFEAF